MLSGFEALGAASAVLQVISFATDLAVACKNAYDGATTSQDDLERHSREMFEAVGRVHTRCEQMATANSKFANPNLQTIAHDCKNAAKKLEDEVQYITKIQAKGNVLKSLRKAFRASRHRKTIQTVEESLSRYQHLIHTELMSHLCSQSDAIYLQQKQSFHQLDNDVQLLVNQLAHGVTEVTDLVEKEHATTRAAFTQETARTQLAINTHTDTQVLGLKTTADTDQRCKTFLQSLKGERMNQRYTDVMDPEDASFNQIFATYEEMVAMRYDDPEAFGDQEDDNDVRDDGDSGVYQSSERSSVLSYTRHGIWSSWESFISWLQSDEVLFYIEGKPGSGKSTLVKFILGHVRTGNLIRQWSPDATIIRYFFWKIGSHEQNSIKGLWCSLLYQRLEDQPSLIQDILRHFQRLSLNTSYHDWTIKELQSVWEYATSLDDRHLCVFIDGLDEIRNEDGFSRLIETIQLLLRFPKIKLCVSTRPEAQIMRWLRKTSASGFRLEDLTKHDMIVFVRNKLYPLLPDKPELFRALRQDLVTKAQGVFLWLHLAIKSLVEGIENSDPDNMLLCRLDGLPQDLESLYMDMWQRLNANNSVYRQIAARYFRYVLLSPFKEIDFNWNGFQYVATFPFSLLIACAEDLRLQQTLLGGAGENTIETVEILRMCEANKVSIRTRCAGLLEIQHPNLFLARDNDTISGVFGKVAFIHRTAHDFLIDTETGRRILKHDPSSDFDLECRLLKGLICAIMVSPRQLDLTWVLSPVVDVVEWFAKRWGGSSLEVAIQTLDAIRPSYDNGHLKTPRLPAPGDVEGYRPPFFSFLTQTDTFNDFVISRLTTTNSVQIATDTLREGWMPGSERTLSKRLFDALLFLGADPHKRGGSSRNKLPGPFVSNVTAFTNLLVSFFVSGEHPINKFTGYSTGKFCKSLYLQDPCEIVEMATRMARSIDNLNAVVALIGHNLNGQFRGMQTLQNLGTILLLPDKHVNPVVVYQVNLQFLLLYLLTRAGGGSAESVLRRHGAVDILPKVNRPSIKMPYFLLPKTGQHIPKKFIDMTCHRVAPRASYLPESLIEHLSHSPVHRATEAMFSKLDLKRHSDGASVLYDIRTDFGIVTHDIKDGDIGEVSFEAMITSLAQEDPEVSTYEEAGIIPSTAFLRRQREYDNPYWCWFPLLMGRLEAAADSREKVTTVENPSN